MLEQESNRSASRAAADGIVTGDMLAQYAYCARRFHLAYVEGRWADNRHTDRGRLVHERVDSGDDGLPPADEYPVGQAETLRSVFLSDEGLGLAARLDAVEVRRETDCKPDALPLETKSGSLPPTAEGTWEPERLQLMAQGLLLRAHGWDCSRGAVFYAASHRRVEVALDARLEARMHEVEDLIRQALQAEDLPPPLTDSPKCPGCSLAGLCLPDETVELRGDRATAQGVRRLFPARDDAVPFYVQEQGAMVGKRGEGLHVSKGGARLAEIKLKDVSQLVLCGNVTVSPPALHLLCEAGVAVIHLSMGHWFYGVTSGSGLRNAFDRAAQFRVAEDARRCLALSRAIVVAKGANQRTLLRRNADPQPAGALADMAALLDRVPQAESPEMLLGLEGSLAAAYFGSFASMIRSRSEPDSAETGRLAFDFRTRNRRPPRDPVNAMLSFGYALLVKECTVALVGAGLDPYWGFYHRPRHGRPALALDLMEELRPLITDSAVITAINTGMVTPEDFVTSASGCALSAGGRKAFIRAFEGRLDQLATHPVFDYRLSWRRLIAVQAQFLARYLRGDVPAYQGITMR